MRSIPVAQIEIQDVWVSIVFPDSEPEAVHEAIRQCAERSGLKGSIVTMWRDSTGRKRFISEPAQRPFFESVRYDQLYAQRNQTINFPDP